MLSLSLLFVIGGLLLLRVDPEAGQRAAMRLEDGRRMRPAS
jgi:hypothetical protein